MLTGILVCVLIAASAANTGHPTFDVTYEDVVFPAGQTAEIWCIVTYGDWPLTYTWYDKFNDEIASENCSICVHSYHNYSILHFDVLEKTHAGTYLCKAKNFHGMASKAYHISVNDSIDQEKEDKNVTIRNAEVLTVTENSVEFILFTDGDVKTILIRYIEVLEKQQKTASYHKGDRIVIGNLIPSGRYQFEFMARGSSGFDSEWTQPISVVLLPDVPDVIFRKVENGAVRIEWFRKTSHFLRGTIDEYMLSYNSIRMKNGNEWNDDKACITTIKISSPCYAPRYTIADLSRLSYYEIRLRAHTASGYGKDYKSKVYIE